MLLPLRTTSKFFSSKHNFGNSYFKCLVFVMRSLLKASFYFVSLSPVSFTWSRNFFLSLSYVRCLKADTQSSYLPTDFIRSYVWTIFLIKHSYVLLLPNWRFHSKCCKGQTFVNMTCLLTVFVNSEPESLLAWYGEKVSNFDYLFSLPPPSSKVDSFKAVFKCPPI